MPSQRPQFEKHTSSRRRQLHDAGIKLDFGTLKPIYGRQKELKQLHCAYDRVCQVGSRAEVLVVCGSSGLGKTYLVRQLQQRVNEQRQLQKGFFVSGKFDQYQQLSDPFSALVRAFSDLCQQILQRDDFDEIKSDILESFSSKGGGGVMEGRLLVSLVPEMDEILWEDSDPSCTQRTGSDDKLSASASSSIHLTSKRVMLLFQSFLQGLCRPSRPLVLFLDDYQWADTASKKMVRCILSSAETKNLLFVSASRESRKNPLDSPPSTKDVTASGDGQNSRLTTAGGRPIVFLELKSLTTEHINALLSDLFHLDTETTMPLASVVMHKTAGNIYFILRYLELLQSMNLVWFSLAKTEWEWDLMAIKANTNVAENVVQILTQQTEHLPGDVQYSLTLAACLGFVFQQGLLVWMLIQEELFPSPSNKPIMEAVAPDTKRGFEERLDQILAHAAQEGLVEFVADGLWKFSHDRVQQCMYGRVRIGPDRDLLHLRIGRLIREVDTEHKYLFLMTDQMNRGSAHLLADDHARIELIELNLRASRMSKSRSAFLPAAQFLRKALELIVMAADWNSDNYYDLVLEVHLFAAEIEFSCGEPLRATTLADTVLSHARSFDDKIRAYYVKVGSLGLDRKFTEAAHLACYVVRRLGVPMPKRPNVLHMLLALVRIKMKVRGKTDQEFLNLPIMADNKKIMAMKFLSFIDIYASVADGLAAFQGLALVKMMLVTLRDGLCEGSANAFGAYGIVLCTMGDYMEGFRYGEVSLAAARQWEDKIAIPRAYVACYGFISHFKLPLLNVLDPLLEGYRIGHETGDLDYGSFCLGLYVQLYVYVGLPLDPFLNDMAKFTMQLIDNRHDAVLLMSVPFYQLALNFTGRSRNPLLISLDTPEMKDLLGDELVKERTEQPKLVTAPVYLARMFAFCIMGPTEEAQRAYEKLSVDYNESVFGSFFGVYFLHLCAGLIYFELSRTKKRRIRRSYRRRAEKHVKYFSNLARQGSVNCVGMLLLLTAEKLLDSGRDTTEIQKAYEHAILALTRSSFTSIAALANEKAGEAMKRVGDNYRSQFYFRQAVRLYLEWGATVKARQLVDRHALPETIDDNSRRRSQILGRQRFDDVQVEEMANLSNSLLDCSLDSL